MKASRRRVTPGPPAVPNRPVPGPPPQDMLDMDDDEVDLADDDGVTEVDDVQPTQRASGSDIKIEVVDITGEMVRPWLEGKARNRNIRKNRVVEFARDMLNDNWHETGEAIKFDVNGKLVDGQHRCEALALASKTKPDLVLKNVLVVRGIPAEAQMVMDTNTRRTAADQLRIAGFDNYAQLSAAAKWCLIWDRKVLYADRMLKSVTHAEILEYVKANPELREICTLIMNRLNKYIDMPSGYIGAGYYICWRISPDDADEFFARLADGIMLGKGNPILALRERLRDLKGDHSSLPGDLYLSLLFRTWNAYRENKEVHKLQVWKDKQPIKCPNPI